MVLGDHVTAVGDDVLTAVGDVSVALGDVGSAVSHLDGRVDEILAQTAELPQMWLMLYLFGLEEMIEPLGLEIPA